MADGKGGMAAGFPRRMPARTLLEKENPKPKLGV
jgi:hypothetical protein